MWQALQITRRGFTQLRVVDVSLRTRGAWIRTTIQTEWNYSTPKREVGQNVLTRGSEWEEVFILPPTGKVTGIGGREQNDTENNSVKLALVGRSHRGGRLSSGTGVEVHFLLRKRGKQTQADQERWMASRLRGFDPQSFWKDVRATGKAVSIVSQCGNGQGSRE